MKLEPRTCPVCGSGDESNVVAEAAFDESRLDGMAFASRKTPEFMHYRLVRCPGCDALYANPAPNLEWIRGNYRAAEFEAVEESRHAAATYARELKRILANLPDRIGALDIGAGDGTFLERLLDLGFSEVVGVEPSRAPLERASAQVRPLLREGFFRSGEFEAESLSLVGCFQTLEHTDDPAGLCREAFRILKPGGALFTIAHNHRAVSARLLGKRSPIYDIEHLQLLSPRSLRRLMESTGFENVDVRSLRNDYPLHYWIRLLPLGGRIKGSVQGLLKTVRLADLVLPVWAGNLVSVAFKPH